MRPVAPRVKGKNLEPGKANSAYRQRRARTWERKLREASCERRGEEMVSCPLNCALPSKLGHEACISARARSCSARAVNFNSEGGAQLRAFLVETEEITTRRFLVRAHAFSFLSRRGGRHGV